MIAPDPRASFIMEDELTRTKPGQEDEYMEEGDAEESVRAGVRVLDENSDSEDGDGDGDREGEGDGAGVGDGSGDDAQRGRDNMLKDMSAISPELGKNVSSENKEKSWCEPKQCKKNVTPENAKTIPPPAVPSPSLEIHGSSGKKFPQQYYQIRANRQRTNNEVSLGGVGGDTRIGGERGRPDNGFNIPNDHRQMSAKNFHRVDVGRNISTSFSVDLGCLACSVPRSIKEGMGAGRAQVVVVSDQAFPPILPTVDGRCLAVVRVEDAALSELASAFFDLFANFVSPAGAFPPGSLILVGSLSHLGNRGICNYSEELVRVLGSLSAKVGVGVEVVPMVFVPLGGIGDPGWVRMPGSWPQA